MDFVETDGDTIDQAIENALKMLGVSREKITVDVLAEGKKGIFGFGAQRARVRAALRTGGAKPAEVNIPVAVETVAAPVTAVTPAEIAAVAEKAKTVLTDILGLMGVQSEIELI